MFSRILTLLNAILNRNTILIRFAIFVSLSSSRYTICKVSNIHSNFPPTIVDNVFTENEYIFTLPVKPVKYSLRTKSHGSHAASIIIFTKQIRA